MNRVSTSLWMGFCALAVWSSGVHSALPSTVQKRMIPVGEWRGIRSYIHPESLRRTYPFAQFRVYTVFPPSAGTVGAIDTSMSVDCVAALVRVVEIVRYDRRGQVVSERLFGPETATRTTESLVGFREGILRAVC
ncbi:MAG: hypothetical protein HC919_00355 [Oscillatoriales cyanobacterium SM2_2_1]|nr:hypothetical protein [Oscillatoriales cyanobacterium SM2_2_1]